MSKFLTPAEQAIADRTAADIAAGKDPFGDDEELVRESIEDQAAKAQAKVDRRNGVEPEAKEEGEEAESEGGEIDAAAEGATDASGDATEDKPAAEGAKADATDASTAAETDDDEADDDDEPVLLAATDLNKVTADEEKLLADKDALLAKLMDGEIDAPTYSKDVRAIDKSLNTLTVQRALQEQNHQNVFAHQRKVIDAIAAESKQAGFDYGSDLKAVKQFDTALKVVLSDPDNASRSFRSMAREAHATVLALRGIANAKKTPPVAAAPAPAPAPKPVPKPPVTLRNVPNAGTSNTAGNVLDQLKGLKGQDYAKAFARLTPAQKAALTDAE